MLDRSIPTREALDHSILISEVKDMNSDVFRALKAFLSKKNFEPCLPAQFKQFSRKKNYIDFDFLFATFSLLRFFFKLKFIRIPFFLSSHTHSYLLIFFEV
jgi:hypothetical protein